MNDKPSVMKTVIIEDEKAAVRNLTSLLNEVKPEAEIIAKSQRTKSFPFAFLLLMKYNERQAKCYENSYY